MAKLYLNLILFLLLILNQNLYSQSLQTNILYLKNGSIISCKILEIKPDESIKIESSAGDILVFKMTEILRVENIADKQEFVESTNLNSSDPLSEKISNIFRLGMVRNFNNENIYFTVSNIFGYQFGEFFTGLGVMYDLYDNNSFIPVFADFRYVFESSKVKPYLFSDIGYSFGTKIGNGLLFNAGVGLRTEIANEADAIFELAYKNQQINFELYGFDITGNAEFITLNVGVQF
jgi:hypothetical protein